MGGARRALEADPKAFGLEPPLQSYPGDAEVLIHIPFTCAVRLKSLCISGGGGGRHPESLKVYANREGLDFAGADATPPLQTIPLGEDVEGAYYYPLRPAPKFSSVHNLTLVLTGTHGAADFDVRFIGLKGIASAVQRGAVKGVVYEVRPQSEDHPVGEEAKARLGTLGL